MQSEAPLTLILSPLRAGRGELERACLGSLVCDPDTVPRKVPFSLRKRERVRVRLDCMDTAKQVRHNLRGVKWRRAKLRMATMERVSLRQMTDSDLQAADELRRLAGWNQTLEDWRRLLWLEPRGCFVAAQEGKVQLHQSEIDILLKKIDLLLTDIMMPDVTN